jgi:copper chaperone CopZ
MKTIKFITTVLVLTIMISCNAQETNTNENHVHHDTLTTHAMMKVWGNCGMCKKTIEGSIADIDGLASGSWDVEKKVLNLQFDSSKTSIAKISKAVASAGYDTEFDKADDKAYDGLHGCCQYDRKK